MLERLTARPWLAGPLGRALGGLHATMHHASATTLPDSIAELRRAVRAAERFAGPTGAAHALERIERLPRGAALCHGDFHPGNVMMSSAGPTVIDWLTAGSGPPAADVARTLFLVRDGRIPTEIRATRRTLIRLVRRRLSAAYLHAYRRRHAIDLDEVAAWRLPILVARLDEDVEGERDHVLRLVGEEIGAEPPGFRWGSAC